MINSEHILSGYVILRGTFQIHAPMALSMLLFIGSQPKDFNGNPSENFVGASLWYWLAFS